MIQIHNKSTYQRVYNRYSAEFLESFCAHRLNGLQTNEALEAARISIQISVSLELDGKNPNKLIIIQAYKNIRNDTKLIEKAIKYYQGMK